MSIRDYSEKLVSTAATGIDLPISSIETWIAERPFSPIIYNTDSFEKQMVYHCYKTFVTNNENVIRISTITY